MPFFTPNDIGDRYNVTPDVQPVIPPDPDSIAAAAFRQSNPVVSVINGIRNSGSFEPDPTHNPLDTIRGTAYGQRNLDRFAGSRSEAETRSIMGRIDQEEGDRKTLQAGGTMSTLLEFVAGTLDPTIALPGGTFVRAGRGGYSALRSAAVVGLAGGAQAAVQEAALQASQVTRTPGESALAVGSATLLASLIGAGAARLMTKAEMASAVKLLDAEREAIDLHAMGLDAKAPREPGAPPLIPEAAPQASKLEQLMSSTALPQAAGAAASDTRELRLAGFGVDKVPVLGKLVEKLDPISRVLGGASVSARRALADLAEIPLRLEQNMTGEATTAGPALSRLASLQINQTRVAVSDEFDRLWKEVRFGSADQAPFAPRMRDNFGVITGNRPSGLTFDQFKKEISLALQSGDQHEIPQVAQAAQFMRARVFEPWKKRAIEAGLLPEDVNPAGAESYFTRIYNKQEIAARRPEFVNKVQDYLKGDQATKAAAKERLQAYSNGLGEAQDQIKKLTVQAEAEISRIDDLASRQEEVTRFNKLAYQRANRLRSNRDANIEKARGGAPFETAARNRGNTLADQQSGHSGKLRDLEDRLAREIDNEIAVRDRIETEIAAWEGKSVGEAKSAIKAREKYDAEREAAAAVKGDAPPENRLESADAAIDRTVRRILASDRDLTDAELRSKAHQITDRIIGSPDGRLPYDIHQSGPERGIPGGTDQEARGPLKARDFAIPDQTIRDFLEQDAEHVAQIYLRTMAPDVMLTERFGDIRMTEAFRKINDDYAALTDRTKSERERTKLEAERQAVIRDLSAIRDRIRGVYGFSTEAPLRQAARVVGVAKSFNTLTSMGMATISSLPDLAGPVFRHGLGAAFGDAWAPFFNFMTRSSDAWKEAGRQYRAMGIATETMLATRQHEIVDALDLYRPHSRLERSLQWASDKFMIANGLSMWTDWAKINASMIAGSEILRAAKAVVDGKATKKQITNLAENNISPAAAERVWRSFETAGETRDGVHLPNTADWTDLQARTAFEGAVAREADIAVITPGQEKPLWLSHPILSVFGQFKSFTAAATQRILIANMQRHDADVLSGLVTSIGLGMLSYKLNSLTGGQPTSDRPQDWLKEAISRGGVLGWLEEGNSIASKVTRGGLDLHRLYGADKPVSRFASLSAFDQFLGPTAGKVQSLIKVTSGATSGDWTHADTTALRRLFMAQNIFYLRGLFNEAEAGFNGAFGVEPKPPPKQ